MHTKEEDRQMAANGE